MPMPQVNYNAPPMSWQQQVMARQQQGAQLAQDPTNINYIQPIANSMQNYGGPAGAMDPGSVQNALGAVNGLAAQRNLRAGPGGMSTLGVNMGVNPNGGPLQSMFARPRPVRGFTPNNMAAGPSGFRFVRPMAR
jgi:hypothetical protein